MKKADNKKVKEVKDQILEGFEDQISEDSIDTTEQSSAILSDDSQDDVALWQDKYARLSAEFDNFRKRTVKEKMDLITNGGEKVLKSVIEIVDDFERAMKVLNPESPEYLGIELIFKKFLETLKSQGVNQIEAIGQPLDVDFHEAIAKFATGDESKNGIVIDVVQNGYMLNGKVLRFAKVVVGE